MLAFVLKRWKATSGIAAVLAAMLVGLLAFGDDGEVFWQLFSYYLENSEWIDELVVEP